MAMLLNEIRKVLGLPIDTRQHGKSIQHLSIDSRQINDAAETLFVALQTPKRNGHHFIEAAYTQGVRCFLVHQHSGYNIGHDAHLIEVADTLSALQTIAAAHRAKFSIPVVGITGSNGKTIVKEWLYQLLHEIFNICRSPRSYNSQVGVPVSVWQLHPQHELAIFEAGISTVGEMEKLQAIIQPTIGIFTNLGTAHSDGFDSDAEKLQEKWKLFSQCQTIIFNADHKATEAIANQQKSELFSWGTNAAATVQIITQKTVDSTTIFSLTYQGHNFEVTFPFTDAASIDNCMHCLCAGLVMKVSVATLQQQFLTLQPLQMRLQWKKGIYQSLLLNDSYSYDISSLEIALNHLLQQSGHNKLMAILSDLPGNQHLASYQQVANLLAKKGIQQLIGVGKIIQSYRHVFALKQITTTWFDTTQELLYNFDRTCIEKATVLIKGARIFEFEKIVDALQQQQHETFLEINLTALNHNLNAYRKLLKPATKIMVMLKAFGYGTTDAELGRWLQHKGVDYLAVAYADEGVTLRQGGVTLPIMVMNPDEGSFPQMLQYKLEPELYSTGILKSFLTFLANESATHFPVHLKVDTGMHRLGFEYFELPAITDLLQQQSYIKVVTVFTHLVAAENPEEDAFTLQQSRQFEHFCEQLTKTLPYPFVMHAANTAGIARHPTLHYQMVRLGIGLFGAGASSPVLEPLQPATALYTTVAQVKKVQQGESIGYGRQTILASDKIIATVRIGYADGYTRRLGEGVGEMFIGGKRVPVIGKVCMDMTMLDVTELPNVQPATQVEVFGIHIPISELAQKAGTISYEIMTGINQRVKRVLVDE